MAHDQATIDRISDEMAAYAEDIYGDINEAPYVARGAAPDPGHIRDDWTWTKVSSFKTSISGRGILLYSIVREGGEVLSKGAIAKSTFNKQAREMLRKSLDKTLDRDSSNPEEADFIPVTNRRP